MSYLLGGGADPFIQRLIGLVQRGIRLIGSAGDASLIFGVGMRRGLAILVADGVDIGPGEGRPRDEMAKRRDMRDVPFSPSKIKAG